MYSACTYYKQPWGKCRGRDFARCTEGMVEFAEPSKHLKDVKISQKMLRGLLGFVLVSVYTNAAKVWLGIFAKELTEVKKILLKSTGNEALTSPPKTINHYRPVPNK